MLFQLKRTAEELNSAIEAKEELMQRCHELDLQVLVALTSTAVAPVLHFV